MEIPSIVFRWTSFPFVRITLFFIGGVLLAVYRALPLTHPWSYWAVAGCVAGFFVLHRLPLRRLRRWSGAVGLLALLLLGFVCVKENSAALRPDHLVRLVGKPDFYVVRISSYPHEKEKTWRLAATVEQVRREGQWKPVSGTIYLYQSKMDGATPYQYGDRLMVKGYPQAVEGPRNPGEFDYRRFLSFRNIFHQHFVLPHQVRWIDHSPANAVLAATIRARAWAEEQIKKFIPSAREQAVAKALVLGITDGLDNELTTAYAATGAMHVLAVSGLHVSIIYQLLLLVLKPLLRFRHGLVLQTAVALLVLWFYAAITGLSPSVLRAVTMFSFLVLALPFGQRTNIYNTLAVAAFCLLLYDPLMIMSVGFQLSFLAVVGIVYLQPLLYGWWEPRSYWLDQIWKVSCVSFAAQLATFALGLLYFHQFPNYFLFSNLVVIPGSFAVLVGGLALLAAAPVSGLAHGVGWALEKLIWLLNQFVLWVESWPYSLAEGWYITTWQCWVLMAMVICVVLCAQYRSVRWLYVAAVAAVFYSMGNWQRFNADIRPDRFTVYHVRRHTAFEFTSGGRAYQFVDTALVSNAQSFRFHISPNRLRAAVGYTGPLAEYPASAFRAGVFWTVWNGKVLAHIRQKNFLLPLHAKIDWLIVSSNVLRDLNHLPPAVSVGVLIFDTSCSAYIVKKLTAQAHTRGWRTHDVSQHAFQHIL